MIKKGVTDEDVQQPEVSEQDLGLVKDVIKTISKTIKTFNVYPKDNPIYQKFADALSEKFAAFFEHNEELPLDVEYMTLSFKGKEVYYSEEKTDNIALILYTDGIRQISFHKEISAGELLDFIDILRLAPKAEGSGDDDDDIVTLLWERNIKNMGYTAVEDAVEDELLVEESLLLGGEAPAESAEGGPTTLHGASYSKTTIKPHGLRINVGPLTAEELENIKAEIFAVDERSLVASAAGLFFELLSNEKDISTFTDMSRNLGKIIDIRMQKKDIAGAIDILRMLKKISLVTSSEEQTAVVMEVLDHAGSVENIRGLLKDAQNAAEIAQYLRLLEKGAVPGMISVLGEIQDRRLRRLLCEVLAELGRQDVNLFADALKDERWFVVRNIVMILGMTKEPSAVKLIEKALRHPEVRVRREAVRSLETIPSDDTKRLFLSAMKDADASVRVGAVRALRRFRGASEVFQAIKEESSREALKKRPFSEKKELVETLAWLGGENALPHLSDLFKKKGFIEKDDSVEIRACAAYGLGIVGTAEAAALLEKEADSRKSLLREACHRSLKELKARGNNRR